MISFEILPPQRGHSINGIIDIVEDLLPLNPAWIDVTAHASRADLLEQADGSFQRRISRKRPGTIGICGVIKNRFKIDTVAHVLCLGFTKEETEDALIELQFLGVENVLALRGDSPNFQKKIAPNHSANHYAMDLVSQIVDLKKGKYLQELEGAKPIDFCVGVAGYPEKHFEAPNLATDLKYLKSKIDKGAEYVVTQMFFENKNYFNFVRECRELGISVPIVPGLKLVHTQKQMNSLPKTFKIDLPEDLTQEMNQNPNHSLEIGQEYCIKQCRKLLENNVPGLHFYVMNDAQHVVEVVKKLGL